MADANKTLKDFLQQKDAEGSGKLTRFELIDTICEVQSRINRLQVAKLLDKFGVDDDDNLDYNLFVDWLWLDAQTGMPSETQPCLSYCVSLKFTLPDMGQQESEFAAELQRHAINILSMRTDAARSVCRKSDPRWNIVQFDEWCDSIRLCWVRVEYLREQLVTNFLPRQQDCPQYAVHIGKPPENVQLYAVTYPGYLHMNDDVCPSSEVLAQLVAALDSDRAFDVDLVFTFWTGFPQPPFEDEHEESVANTRKQNYECGALWTHFRCKYICIPEVEREDGSIYNCLDHTWGAFEFKLATFTLRTVNQDNATVLERAKPEWLMNYANLMVTTYGIVRHEHNRGENCLDLRRSPTMRKGRAPLFAHSPERAWNALEKMLLLSLYMPKAHDDVLGFQTSCAQAKYRWVRVSYLRQLQERSVVAPRYQDLPFGSYVDGAVPAGSQSFVVSYSWSATSHPFPGGSMIRNLIETLDELGAKSSDVVFIDFFSLPQAGGPSHEMPAIYTSVNPRAKVAHGSSPGKVILEERTQDLLVQQRFALFECSRLYAFKECKVIVMPQLEQPHLFPEHGEITIKTNTICDPPREELHTAWGFCKTIPYSQGGWTCAEYSVARKNGTIANGHHAAVKEIEASRSWPTSVTEYADMMDVKNATPVIFTRKGDRDVVRFNFYKYCYGLAEIDD